MFGKDIFMGIVLGCCFVLSSCYAPKEGLYPPQNDNQEKVKIYIIQRGWHTGILMKKQRVDTLLPKITRDFSDAVYLTFSWGDRRYFMAEKGTVGLALRAALLPTQSVIHVDGYSRLPSTYLSSGQAVGVELSREGFSLMMDFIRESLARGEEGNLWVLRHSPQAMSAFYLSDITYWGTRTCNVWTARALRKAGFPINPMSSLTASSIMRKVR